jgi:hypothetical protein
MDNLNRIKSYKNINEGHLIANNGVYGIRRNLIDNKGRLFYGKSFSSVSSCSYHFYPKSTLRNKVYSETIKVLLEHIAKYSGLLSTLGLFDGKIGVAILIYNGSRYFRSPLLAKIADALIDDITEEIQHITSCGFTTGLSGIAWGINNLNDNGFIELDSDYFNDIDRILFCDEEITEGPDKAEYSFLGLYILSRYEGSSDKSYWITQGDIYCAQMLKLLESKQDLFTHNPSILIPFLYFLLKWREYSIPFINLKAFLNVFRNLNKFILSDKHTINYAFANHLYYRLSEQYASIQLPETLTITDINTVYFNQLLYPDILLFPEKILSDSISIIIDKKPQKELLLFLNSETVGLSRYISGFAWSLLQFTKRFESK